MSFVTDGLRKKFRIEEQIQNRGLTEVEELQARHREIIRLASVGKRNKDIAEILGCSPSTVSKVLQNPLAKSHMNQMNKNMDEYLVEAQQHLTELLPEVTGLFERIVNGELKVRTELQVSVAKDILDRTGLPKVSKSVVESNSLSAKITAEDIQRMRQNRDATPANDVEINDAPDAPEGSADSVKEEENESS